MLEKNYFRFQAKEESVEIDYYLNADYFKEANLNRSQKKVSIM